MNSSLRKFSFQIVGKSFLILCNFWCFNSFILSAIAAVKKEKTEMSFECCKEPIHPISEIATSDVSILKIVGTRVIKNHMFRKKWRHNVTYSGCQVIKWLQWGRRSWNIPRVGLSHPILWHVIYSNIYMFWLIEIEIDCMK